MKNRYIEKIAATLRSRSLFSVLNSAVARRRRIFFIRKRGILELQRRDVIYRKLCREYRNIIEKADRATAVAPVFPKIIWWCWLQGYDKAPELVKSCYESLKSNMEGYEIRIITFENLSDYITLPDHITEKFNSGIIDFTHYSDIIRLELLIRHGGVWIDSTVLCTDNEMAHVMEKSPLFVYKILMGMGNNSLASNWLISSRPGLPVLILTRDLLLEYWKRNNTLKHYFLFHLFFSIAMKEFPEIWGEIPVYNNVSPQILVGELNNTYSCERYVALKRFSSFHKLTYKADYSQKDNTFYDVLIRRRQF